MTYKIYIFDQDGTLYPKSSLLGLRLSFLTQQWLSKKGAMNKDQFKIFKKEFPNFIEALKKLELTLQLWHKEVQQLIIPEIENLLRPNPQIKRFISSLHDCYLVTFSSKDFSKAVLHQLDLQECFRDKFYSNDGRKFDIYKKILKLNSIISPKDILVIGDSVVADLYPAEKLGMNQLYVNPDIEISSQLTHIQI